MVEYDEIYSFIYSPRPQTVSAKIYYDDVPNDVKRERLKKVQTLQREISLAKNRQRIGEREEVLVDGPSKLKAEQSHGPHPRQPNSQLRRLVSVCAARSFKSG